MAAAWVRPTTEGTLKSGTSHSFFHVYGGAGAGLKSMTGSPSSAFDMNAAQIGAANVPPNTLRPWTLRIGRSGV